MGRSKPALWVAFDILFVLGAQHVHARQGVSEMIHVDDLNDGQVGSGTSLDPYRDLQLAIDRAESGALLLIESGRYEARPRPYRDPSCGNCSDEDYKLGADATVGFVVRGKALHLMGRGPGRTVLVTGSGYGLLFEDAGSSSVKRLKVTGGHRDADGRATDAGIVVRHTSLFVSQVSVSDNFDLYSGPGQDPVVGIGGIFGREESRLKVVDCRIEDNSWDGIALYRGIPGKRGTGPVAHVEGCRIGRTWSPQGGRGAGIGVTWDAELVARGNLIHGYWKGIGSFGHAEVRAYNNVVRDQRGWGIIASEQSIMHAHNNLVIHNGTTGMAAWNAGVRGSFINNIVIGNGVADKEWVGKKTGVWLNAPREKFKFAYNLVYDNRDQDVCRGGIPGSQTCQPIVFDGIDGNLHRDPELTDDHRPRPGSPAIDNGDPEIRDADGSRSDIGVFGGPDAPERLPACKPKPATR
ncbi:MAG: right-handed parallel beta-helix repeat-containing protein [Deltaproteobacteria bacterium]|nr:right-handed parallel beta-helix repeat-containing protein [Deltaproteobacteria bacterium]